MVNRRDEFARAKQGNLQAVDSAISQGKIHCFYQTTVNSIHENSERFPLEIHLNTKDGLCIQGCHRVIARLGAVPPRNFVESIGVEFATKDITALPVLSEQYQSSVDGLYIVGALAGYPLIKQAMNQGYEVIETICGETVEPADEPLLAKQLKPLQSVETVSDKVTLLRQKLAIFSDINILDVTAKQQTFETTLGRFPARNFAEGQQAKLCIRQRAIQIIPPHTEQAEREKYQTVRARVMHHKFLGDVALIELSVEGLDKLLLMRLLERETPEVGTEIDIYVEPASVLVFET